MAEDMSEELAGIACGRHMPVELSSNLLSNFTSGHGASGAAYKASMHAFHASHDAEASGKAKHYEKAAKMHQLASEVHEAAYNYHKNGGNHEEAATHKMHMDLHAKHATTQAAHAAAGDSKPKKVDELKSGDVYHYGGHHATVSHVEKAGSPETGTTTVHHTSGDKVKYSRSAQTSVPTRPSKS